MMMMLMMMSIILYNSDDDVNMGMHKLHLAKSETGFNLRKPL